MMSGVITCNRNLRNGVPHQSDLVKDLVWISVHLCVGSLQTNKVKYVCINIFTADLLSHVQSNLKDLFAQSN